MKKHVNDAKLRRKLAAVDIPTLVYYQDLFQTKSFDCYERLKNWSPENPDILSRKSLEDFAEHYQFLSISCMNTIFRKENDLFEDWPEIEFHNAKSSE